MEEEFKISSGVTFDSTRGRTPLLDALRKEREPLVLRPSAQSPRIKAMCIFLLTAKVLRRTALAPVRSVSYIF